MDIKFLDRDVNPGDNFYKFAAGNWINYNKQPDDQPAWGTFDVINDKVDRQLYDLITKDLLEASKKPDCDIMTRKISDYYNILTNYDKRNKEGISVLKPYLDKFKSFNTKEEIMKYFIKDMLSFAFFRFSLDTDRKNSKHYEVHMSQDLLLGNKDYYADNELAKATKAKYIEVCQKALLEGGYDAETAKEFIDTYLKYDEQIAEVAYSYEKLDKPDENYHPMTVDEASEYFNYDIRKHLSWMGMNETEKIIVGQPEPIKKAIDLINSMPVDDLRKCLEFSLFLSFNTATSEKFGEIWFEFDQFLTGAKKRREKWRRIIAKIDSVFSESLGKKYVEKYFNEDAKARMIEMIKNLFDSYRDIIRHQSWMSDTTKIFALDKLRAMKYKIGYPNKWKDYSDMPIDTSKNYLENTLELSRYFHKRFLQDYYNKDVDPEEYPMTPQTVNACYMQDQNEICFPAGILQEPFFNNNSDDAVNYGAIGVIIGHEITHGFDTAGKLFDKDGEMYTWWTDDDSAAFNCLTSNTKNHFDNLNVLDDLKCNGSLTLNENIADFGGLKIAYNALSKIMKDKDDPMIDGFTWQQRFFLSYAQVWAGVETEEIIRHSTLNDNHSLHYMRVNGTLPMFDPWYDAFNLNRNNCSMFVEKGKRGKVW